MNKGATFFRFFISELNNVNMKIPTLFTKHIEEALPENVFLRDRHNQTWPVKVAKVGGDWCFVDGWDKFVNDNTLITGDLMTFEYFQKGLFYVKLYGLSATEKSVENNINYHENHDKNEEIEDDENVSLSVEENGSEEVEEATLNNEGAVVGINHMEKRNKRRDNCYRYDIFEAGLAEQPTNPYFVAKIMPKRKNDLFIPCDVIKDYGLNLGNEITLVDPNGREFRAKCKRWNDGRVVLSGGWKSICRLNNITLEDLCIFEFGDQRQFLHVTFVRGHVQN